MWSLHFATLCKHSSCAEARRPPCLLYDIPHRSDGARPAACSWRSDCKLRTLGRSHRSAWVGLFRLTEQPFCVFTRMPNLCEQIPDMQALGWREHARPSAYHVVQLVLGARPPPAAWAATTSVLCASGNFSARVGWATSTWATEHRSGQWHRRRWYGPVSKRAAGDADAWVTYHVSGLVLRTELPMAA